jgi:hypothetical protein
VTNLPAAARLVGEEYFLHFSETRQAASEAPRATRVGLEAAGVMQSAREEICPPLRGWSAKSTFFIFLKLARQRAKRRGRIADALFA